MEVKLKATTVQVAYDKRAEIVSMGIDDEGKEYLQMPLVAELESVYWGEENPVDDDSPQEWFDDFEDYRICRIYPSLQSNFNFILDNQWTCDYVHSNHEIYEAVSGDDWDYLVKLDDKHNILEIIKAQS